MIKIHTYIVYTHIHTYYIHTYIHSTYTHTYRRIDKETLCKVSQFIFEYNIIFLPTFLF